MRRVDLPHVVRALPRKLRRHRIVAGLIRIWPGSSVALIPFDNTEVFADLKDSGARLTLFTGHYYPQYCEIASLLMRNGAVYFDVGANVGFTAFPLAAALAPGPVEMHLFEANPSCCRLLEATSLHHSLPHVKVVNACVSDSDGIARLAVDLNQTQAGHVSSEGEVEVAQIRLDDYVRARAIKTIDLLKVDVEGFEPRVLRGLGATLASGGIRAIFSEVSAASLDRMGESAAAYLNEIKSHGFRTFYCRDEDRAAGHPDPSAWLLLKINGGSIPVAEAVEVWPDIHTDVLAISESLFTSGEAELARGVVNKPYSTRGSS
jgi:FkbM family methyltransferase